MPPTMNSPRPTNLMHLSDGRRLHILVWMHEYYVTRLQGTYYDPRLKTGWD